MNVVDSGIVYRTFISWLMLGLHVLVKYRWLAACDGVRVVVEQKPSRKLRLLLQRRLLGEWAAGGDPLSQIPALAGLHQGFGVLSVDSLASYSSGTPLSPYTCRLFTWGRRRSPTQLLVSPTQGLWFDTVVAVRALCRVTYPSSAHWAHLKRKGEFGIGGLSRAFLICWKGVKSETWSQTAQGADSAPFAGCATLGKVFSFC